ncbi:hypothetical protein JIN78_00795, partial [Roseibacillus ishigakijimensis]|nr:hypothetical protein [Roseibacillus ishigakijimensis]
DEDDDDDRDEDDDDDRDEDDDDDRDEDDDDDRDEDDDDSGKDYSQYESEGYGKDSDNDYILDENEGGGFYDPLGDEDGDGLVNWRDTEDNGNDGDGSNTDYTDNDENGIPDVFDVDGDGEPNHWDMDSDGDGEGDKHEEAGDWDGDGLPNFLDTDSDNDGIIDGIEGRQDEDNDGNPNYLDDFDDRDSDNDGIANGNEGTGDYDDDGTPNYLDLDSDNDGIPDAEEILSDGTLLDSDGDGNYNFIDIDDDGDGIDTPIDDCPLCNLDDNIIEFDLTSDQTKNYGVDPLFYSYARDIWNEVKVELNCNTDGTPLEEEKRGFDEDRFFLEQDCEVFVTVIYDGARQINSVAWYDAANPNESWTTIWEKFGTGPTAPLIPGSTASLGILPGGTEFRLGLVQDGGNGGTVRIHQDYFLNDGGLELAAANLSLAGNPLIVSFEDQVFQGRDNDFNDVILLVDFVPTAPATLQFAGEESYSQDVADVLEALGWNDEEFEISMDLFDLPASGSVTIDLLGDPSEMDFALALVDYEAVAGLSPEVLPFRSLAGQNAVTILDNQVSEAGAQVVINPEELGLAGRTVMLCVLPHNRFDRYVTNPHRYTARGEGNDTKRQPLFSLSAANPGGKDQFMTFTDGNSTIVMVEDHSRADVEEEGAESDSNFADFWFRITPALNGASIGGGGYYQGTPDPTTGWDGRDGYSGGQKGDF